MNPYSLRAGLMLAVLFVTHAASAIPERRADSREDALNRLADNAGGELTVVAPMGNGAFGLVRANGTRPLLSDEARAAVFARAQNFLSIYGALAGVQDPMTELSPLRVSADAAGNQHAHFTQVHKGLPVFGARTVVHMNGRGIYGVNGVFVPDLASLPTTPVADLAKLRTAALLAVQKSNPGKVLAVESSQLMVYRSGLLELHDGKNYLAYEVLVRSNTGDVRERVLLDAIKGGVINRINLIHSVLNREIYTPSQVAPDPAGTGTSVPIPPVLTEGSPAAPADIPLSGDGPSDPTSRAPRAPVSNLYLFAGGTYELYKNLIGREGYDDGDTLPEMQVQKSVYLINDRCPNAYWNGDSTNYCPGFDADDVVSHEWSHAYTEFTHNLVYQYQSGALNESYSDIFGETYDLVNGIEGPLGATLTEGEYLENGGSRWVVGEDLSEAASALLLRDMWDPDNFMVNVPVLHIPVTSFSPSPGSVITSPNYYCDSGDGGGVHTNSGVPNHAYAMLVDGKEFNGVVIPKIGMTKAAQIYLQAETQYQTPTTNFAQHADALEQSCKDLKGVVLKDVLGNVSSEVITAADCAAVAAAMQAVEMRQSPKAKCGYRNILEPEADTPKICPAGQFESPDFKEDWEKGIPAGWTQTQNLAGDTEPQPFEWVSAASPAPHKGKSAFADNNGFGSCAPGGDASASWSLDTPEITVADAASFLKFTHYVQTENGFDGGNLKFSINGAAFAIVPPGAFVHNGHSGAFGDPPLGPPPVPADPTGLVGGNNTNPLAGEPAWTGSDQGESTGSWGTTIVDLATLGASAGQKIKFRYDFGQDGCGGNIGWYVDEVAVLHCSATNPNPPPVAPPPPVVVSAPPGGSGGGFFLGAFGPWMLLGMLLLGATRSVPFRGQKRPR